MEPRGHTRERIQQNTSKSGLAKSGMEPSGIDVYGYFNNTDEEAAAAKDALKLIQYITQNDTAT